MTLKSIRLQLHLLKYRLKALRALFNKDQFLLITYRVNNKGEALPQQYLSIMPTETILEAINIVQYHTKAQASVMDQVEAALNKKQ